VSGAAEAVTVAIPVLNGARYLDEVLGAVRSQRSDREIELLVVDSGSTDGSLDIARRHGATIHEIPREQFSHGATRNLMMGLARGAHVAFLTQDATPAHEDWLAALLEGFEQAEDVAAVFGPHEPRPDASHMIKSEMERHFASWGDGERIDVQRLDRSPRGIAEYRRFPGQLTFLSDVNCALARWAWERVPYREVPYAEDQLLGRELIEAGFAKVFHPAARVLHSHDYPPAAFLRRYFDEFRSLREVLGFVQPWGPVRTLQDVRGLVGADRRWLRERGVRGRALVRPLLVSGRHHGLRMAGSIVGTRADRLPPVVRGVLSLEGRSTFTPFDVPASPLLEGSRAFDPDWEWEFVRERYPRRPLALEPHAGRPWGPLTIAWVLPPWEIGSGGHTTIFRLVREMELRGHRCALYVFDPDGSKRRAGEDLRREIVEHFVPIDAPVSYGLEGFQAADVAIATEWRTAFPVRDLPGCLEKVYLVQDHEPEFYATSSQSIWAEESYRMGYRCVAYTPWMADVLNRRYGVEARWFECGTDTDTYRFASEDGREPGLVAVYARQETERRAVELALAGLGTLFERRPGLRVVLFGALFGLKAPFPCEDLGVRPPRELAELYRRASAGVVFSLTTHSLVAQEMMASGLPLVELEGANVSSALGPSGELVELAERTPDAVAGALERLLDDRARAAAMARRARQFVETRTWERAGDQLEEALQDFMARPRQTTGQPSGDPSAPSSARSATSRP
jgi:glycosyltransferase involved in cell wall biosynthesis